MMCSRRNFSYWRHCERKWGGEVPGVMKPQRNPRYLAWIRTQPCWVCGSTRAIEASHAGTHGIGQKSPDSSRSRQREAPPHRPR